MSTDSSPGFKRYAFWGSLALLVILAGVYGWWRFLRKAPKPEPDMVAVLHANNKGIGHMEQFNYDKAVAAFEEVIQQAPDWLPGRINLGIALLNQAGVISASSKELEAERKRMFQRALDTFQEVLNEEPEGSWAKPYAHFCIGIILVNQGKMDDARPHLEAVTRLDPNDAAGWYNYGRTLFDEDPKRSAECCRRAVELDPYLLGAIYHLSQNSYLRKQEPEQLKKALDEFSALRDAEWSNSSKDRYTELGRYAEVIGRTPGQTAELRTGPLPLLQRNDKLQVQLARDTRWATVAELGELRRRVRERFGGVLVVLDYNRDGKPDLFLLGAVIEAGEVHDLLLRNDGAGRFTDVTAEAGLGGARPSLGCCVADFDNNGYPDLFVTGIGEQRLFRNIDGRFEDVTAEAGLDKLNTVCLGSAFVDLDQDGDLDLVVAQYAGTADEALKLLESRKPKSEIRKAGGGLAVFLNVGEAPAAVPSEDPPALKPRFRRATEPSALLGEAVPAVGVTVADFDGDRDLDLLVLADGVAPTLVLNDRLLRFHRAALPEALVPAGRWNGALVLDTNHDGRSDLFVIGPGQKPVLLLAKPQAGQADVGKWFHAGTVNSPALLQAQAVDLDLDGWTDLVGLSEERKPVLLHNDGRRLAQAAEALGRDADWPKDLAAVAVADLDGDGFPDLVAWSESAGLAVYVNQGNGNHGLYLQPTGHRRILGNTVPVRCNADGFGVWTTAQAGDLGTGAEYTTLSAGLGQSRQPLLLGLGRHTQADVVRLRWPDNCWQAEFSLPTGQVTRIEEMNRKGESCPVLFAWDGRRFRFVTDFLGAGSIGEALPGGGHRPPRPEESVKIEAGLLAPRDGYYVLKVAEPMNEVAYLDRLQLLVLDHPHDVQVYPDERFVSTGPPASQDLLAFRKQIFPAAARDHRGQDVLTRLRAWDRDTVSDFARRTWLGIAEEHGIELDFGDRLAQFGPDERLILCIAGWTDYPYPESIWAATQAGVPLLPPILERLDADGRWQPLIADAGFPAGLPRMTTLEVTGKLTGPRCTLRLRTNLCVYWDQIFVAPLSSVVRCPSSVAKNDGQRTTDNGQRTTDLRVTRLEVADAKLAVRGCAQEFSPDGRQPTLYDHDRIEPVLVIRQAGRLTRLGDVTELLHDADDRFVIFGPGDEVTVRFDARRLPELPAGWARSFVLRTWGYCKDCAPFTAHNDTIEPLPFRGMRTYPYGPDQQYPRDRPYEEYQRRFNTRRVGKGPTN